MKEQTLTVEKEVQKEKDRLKLTYKLLSEECDVAGFDKRYALSVSLTDVETGSTEEKLIRDVSVNPVLAEHIFSMVSEGLVTPCSLCEVLEEMI